MYVDNYNIKRVTKGTYMVVRFLYSTQSGKILDSK